MYIKCDVYIINVYIQNTAHLWRASLFKHVPEWLSAGGCDVLSHPVVIAEEQQADKESDALILVRFGFALSLSAVFCSNSGFGAYK